MKFHMHLCFLLLHFGWCLWMTQFSYEAQLWWRAFGCCSQADVFFSVAPIFPMEPKAQWHACPPCAFWLEFRNAWMKSSVLQPAWNAPLGRKLWRTWSIGVQWLKNQPTKQKCVNTMSFASCFTIAQCSAVYSLIKLSIRRKVSTPF